LRRGCFHRGLLGFSGVFLDWRIFLFSLCFSNDTFYSSRSPINQLLSFFDLKFILFIKIMRTDRARVVNSQNRIIVLEQMLKIHDI
jgi:hypothetical protein